MIRNLHITIHEAALRRRQGSASSRRGGAEWDPTEPVETQTDPSDPTEPVETQTDPSDPTEPVETQTDPSDPTEPVETQTDPSDPTRRFSAYGGWGADAEYGPVARIHESFGAAPAVVCCCPCDDKPKAARRPGATERDRSGFVIVRLAAGLDLSTANSLWALATGEPQLPALRAALEMMLEQAEQDDEGQDETRDESQGEGGGVGSVATASVQTAGLFGGRKRRPKHDRRDRGGPEGEEPEDGEPEDGEPADGGVDGEEPEPYEPRGILVSRPLIELDELTEPVQREQVLDAIRALEHRAAQTSFKPRHSLTAYWRVDVRPYPDRIDEVVQRLNALAEVDLAYAELVAHDPAAKDSTEPPPATSPGTGESFEEDQGYLEDAPVGIGARWARRALEDAGGAKAKVRICDLEQQWNPNHDELAAQILNPDPPVGGANRALRLKDDYGHHGTAVLGQLAAVGAGVSGAVKDLGEFVLASHYWSKHKKDFNGKDHAFRDTSGHVASAIVNLLVDRAPYRLAKGDVLLLEVQRGLLPTEIDAADFDAVRLASALGVIVVEAAGNGGVDLDRYVDPDTGRSLNRSDRRFADSGAIVVGAAWSALPHDRAPFSNFGSRVDCFAWGDSVMSCGYGDLSGSDDKAIDYYTNTFSGTSSAAPIIAGAAALVQALHETASGSRLLPRAMRSVLSDPRSGTRQGRGVAGHIGVMPDLCALVQQRLQLVSDVYLRRHPCDDGTRPATRSPAGASPDILLWEKPTGSPSVDPRVLFGEGVRANVPAPGTSYPWDQPEPQPGELYVRLRNRGGVSGSVPVRLYASRAATLITPERWQWIGDLKATAVPVGDTLKVEGPLPSAPPDGWRNRAPAPPPKADFWTGGVVPPLSFLAVHGEGAALPPAPPYFDWDELRRFLRGPGAAWRNVHKVKVGTPIPDSGVQLAFLIAGTPDQGRDFDLEVLQRLPAGVRVELQVPRAFEDKIRQRVHWQSGSPLVLPARARTPLGRIHLSKSASIPAAFVLTGIQPVQPPAPQVGHSLAIRQLWRGEEVGRITWWLKLP